MERRDTPRLGDELMTGSSPSTSGVRLAPPASPPHSSASNPLNALTAATLTAIDERIPPLRLSPTQSSRRRRPLRTMLLVGAALLVLLPAVLSVKVWPAMGVVARFIGPADRLPAGATLWSNDHRTTPLNSADTAFGAQTYPIDSHFATAYAKRGGANILGPAVTPAFESSEGLTQFFASGALLLPGASSSKSKAMNTAPGATLGATLGKSDDLDPALALRGVTDKASGVEWLPLGLETMAAGSAARIGGDDSDITYATLRSNAGVSSLRPAPANAKPSGHSTSSGTVKEADDVFVVEGSLDGHLVGHQMPTATWSYITSPAVSPDGWLVDIGQPLTEPIVTHATVNGQRHQVLAQAFEQTIIITDTDHDESDTAAIWMQPVGLDYLHTLGGPTAHPPSGQSRWTSQDGALRSAPGATSLAVSLGANAQVTLMGTAQWSSGVLWYETQWKTPARNGAAWVNVGALTTAQPSSSLITAGFDALSPDLAAYLASHGNNAGAVVYDVTRGYTYTYNPSGQFTVASSAKVPLLVAYLAYIEAQGRGPNGAEVGTMTAMIEQSDNNAAQLIYDTIGYDSGMNSYMHSWGITDYIPNQDGWGWAEWSPGDMAHLLTLMQQGKVLNSSDRALAFHLMESIESDQRFGVGDTAPAKATVAMKDGWVNEPDGGWAVNTSGIVTVGKETYIITVYTEEGNSFGSGQDIVNHVCAAVAKLMP